MSSLNPLNDISRTYLDTIAKINQKEEETEIKRWEGELNLQMKTMANLTKEEKAESSEKEEEDRKKDDDLAGAPNKNGKNGKKKVKRWWDDDGDGKGYEKGEVKEAIGEGDPQDDAVKQYVKFSSKKRPRSAEKVEASRRKDDDLAGAPLKKEDAQYGYDSKGRSKNPADVEKRKRKEDKLFGAPLKKEETENYVESYVAVLSKTNKGIIEGDYHSGQGEKIQKRTKKFMDDRGESGAPGLDAMKARTAEHKAKRGVKKEETEVTEGDTYAKQLARFEAGRQKRMKASQTYERPNYIPKDQDHSDKYGSSKGKKVKKESFSSWRDDLREIVSAHPMTDVETEKEVTEKKGIKNKVIINPKMSEAVAEIGGQVISETEVDLQEKKDKDTPDQVKAVIAFDKARKGTRDATYDSMHGKKKQAKRERDYAKWQRDKGAEDAQKSGHRWKHAKGSTREKEGKKSETHAYIKDSYAAEGVVSKELKDLSKAGKTLKGKDVAKADKVDTPNYKGYKFGVKEAKDWIQGAVKRPGAFTRKAKAAGMSVQQFAKHVDKNKDKYSTRTERQANLAQTFASMKKEDIEEMIYLMIVEDDRNMAWIQFDEGYQRNPEKGEKEDRKYERVRGERTPMPPRGNKRREEFERWYAANVR